VGRGAEDAGGFQRPEKISPDEDGMKTTPRRENLRGVFLLLNNMALKRRLEAISYKKPRHLFADTVCSAAKGVAWRLDLLLHFNDCVINGAVFDALAPAGGIAF
jgi:hypothetical protein